MKYRSIRKALRAKGLKPIKYSGRWMFGAQCVAVALETSAQIAVLGPELYEGLRIDTLGLGVVAYWPDALVAEQSRGVDRG
jgi:hypothetical protein